jgi:cold shock CspA family protein
MEGKVRSWLAEGAYGFIQPSDGGTKVFVHRSELLDGFQRLVVGMDVAFEMVEDQKGRARATKVRVI